MSQQTLIIPTSDPLSGLGLVDYINGGFARLQSNTSGAGDPAVAAGGVPSFSLWMDTSVNPPILKMRNAANSAWSNIGTLSGNTFQPINVGVSSVSGGAGIAVVGTTTPTISLDEGASVRFESLGVGANAPVSGAVIAGNLQLSSGSISVASGGVSVNGGNIALTTGNVAVSGGNVTVTNGNISVTNGSISGATAAAKTSDTTMATTAFVDRMRSLSAPSTASTGGTAVVGDRGALLTVTGGVTIPANVFAANDTFSIINNSSSNITITQGSGFTLRQAGTSNTGNRTLAQRGLATVAFVSATEAVITGGGLT
jgi:hypothetical protein